MIKHLRLVTALALPLFVAGPSPADSLPVAAGAPDARPLAVGTKAPDAALVTSGDEPVKLAELFGEKPTVLIFYRGGWCPFCNRQLAALGELEPKLRALGYQIVAISPDPAADLKGTTEKNHLSYQLLSDRDMTAAAAYGVAFRVSSETEQAYQKYGIDLAPIPGGRGRWLPVPSVFIVGRDGVIKFVYANPDYKVRLDPEVLLAAAKSAAG